MADARARADGLARLAGVSITGVAAIVESALVEPPRPMYALAMAREAAATPIEAGESEVTVAVTISYRIG